MSVAHNPSDKIIRSKDWSKQLMDLFTQQASQRRITELTWQLAERNATIVDLRAQVADLSVRVADLAQQVTDLLAQVARLSKNSTNSSKPPSSDIVKPPLPPVAPGEKRSSRRPSKWLSWRPERSGPERCSWQDSQCEAREAASRCPVVSADSRS